MAATTITRGRLRRLADLRPEQGRVLTVFLNLDPSQVPTAPARATAINSVVTEAQHRADACEGLDHEEVSALRADVDRVREVLEAPDLAEGGVHGVAVFACQQADVLEVLKLSHPIQSRVEINHRPFLEPLVQAGAPERYCAVLVNRRAGRIFFGAGERLQETDRVVDDVHSQHDQGGWSQARYQRSVEKEKLDHLGHVAEVLFDAFKRRPFDRLVVGGPDEMLGQFEERLHAYMRERLAGRISLDVENSSAEDVRTAAAKIVENAAREREHSLLDRMKTGLGQAQRAAVGRDDTLAALEEMRVEVLLLEESLDEETAEPAIEKALEQSADVVFVRHHDDLKPHGGIAAVLRF